MLIAALVSTSALLTVGAGELVRGYCRRMLKTPVSRAGYRTSAS